MCRLVDLRIGSEISLLVPWMWAIALLILVRWLFNRWRFWGWQGIEMHCWRHMLQHKPILHPSNQAMWMETFSGAKCSSSTVNPSSWQALTSPTGASHNNSTNSPTTTSPPTPHPTPTPQPSLSTKRKPSFILYRPLATTTSHQLPISKLSPSMACSCMNLNIGGEKTIIIHLFCVIWKILFLFPQ